MIKDIQQKYEKDKIITSMELCLEKQSYIPKLFKAMHSDVLSFQTFQKPTDAKTCMCTEQVLQDDVAL